MARKSTAQPESTDTNQEDVTVTTATDTEATATEATETAEAIDLGPFLTVAQSAIDSGDFARVTEAYGALDRKAKGAATRHVNAEMKSALVEKQDTQLALSWSQVVSAMTAPKIAKERATKEPKAPVDSTEATVDRAAGLYLAYKTLAANLPTGTDEDAFKAGVQAKVQDEGLLAEVASIVAYRADTAEDKGDAPEVSDIAGRVVKLAFSGSGRKSGSGGGTGTSYDGPRRSIPDHIGEAFAGQPVGTFLTVAEIRKFESTVYGTDHPSAGAISSALKGKGLPEGVVAAKGGPKDQAGAVKES